MSLNRKKTLADLMPTPMALCRQMAESLPPMCDPRSILDPCCGSSNIVAALRQTFPDVRVFAGDIRPGYRPYALASGADSFHEIDLRSKVSTLPLATKIGSSGADLVVSAPAPSTLRRTMPVFWGMAKAGALVVLFLPAEWPWLLGESNMWLELPAVERLIPGHVYNANNMTDGNRYLWAILDIGCPDSAGGRRILPEIPRAEMVRQERERWATLSLPVGGDQ